MSETETVAIMACATCKTTEYMTVYASLDQKYIHIECNNHPQPMHVDRFKVEMTPEQREISARCSDCGKHLTGTPHVH